MTARAALDHHSRRRSCADLVSDRCRREPILGGRWCSDHHVPVSQPLLHLRFGAVMTGAAAALVGVRSVAAYLHRLRARLPRSAAIPARLRREQSRLLPLLRRSAAASARMYLFVELRQRQREHFDHFSYRIKHNFLGFRVSNFTTPKDGIFQGQGHGQSRPCDREQHRCSCHSNGRIRDDPPRRHSPFRTASALPEPGVYITVKNSDSVPWRRSTTTAAIAMANPFTSGTGGAFTYNISDTDQGTYTEEYRLSLSEGPRKTIAVDLSIAGAAVSSQCRYPHCTGRPHDRAPAFLTEAGREGTFIWSSLNLQSQVTAIR
jgi:hypothetical protein